MFFKKIPQKMCGLIILGFVLGLLLAFVMPPIIIAIVEGVLLIYLCWSVFCH